MARKKLVAGNWKMNTSLKEGLELASEVIHMVRDEKPAGVSVVVCPPHIHLASVVRLAADAPLHVGGQNCANTGNGAYTGEVSAEMLASAGASHVILGHSERRQYQHESSVELNQKLQLAFAAGLVPIFCCGEPQEVREAGSYVAYVLQQLRETVLTLPSEQLSRTVIAYEPIWAIGTGLVASPSQAQEMHLAIRQVVESSHGQALAADLLILYGGSVKADNAAQLFSQPDIDGALVGGASLKSREFVEIVKAAG